MVTTSRELHLNVNLDMILSAKYQTTVTHDSVTGVVIEGISSKCRRGQLLRHYLCPYIGTRKLYANRDRSRSTQIIGTIVDARI
jgi:hypothetical protein